MTAKFFSIPYNTHLDHCSLSKSKNWIFNRACRLWCPSLTGQRVPSPNLKSASTTSSSMTCLRPGMVRSPLFHFWSSSTLPFLQSMQTALSLLRTLGRTTSTGKGNSQRRRGWKRCWLYLVMIPFQISSWSWQRGQWSVRPREPWNFSWSVRRHHVVELPV